MVEDTPQTRFRFSINNSATGASAFVTLNLTKARQQTTAWGTSSNGKTLTFVIDHGPQKGQSPGVAAVRRVRANDGERWHSFDRAALSRAPQLDLETQPGPLANLETRVLFTTPELRLLRAVLHDFKALQTEVIGPMALKQQPECGIRTVAFNAAGGQYEKGCNATRLNRRSANLKAGVVECRGG